MFKFHFNDLGHHVDSKLLNKPINNVESNFCSLDPLGVVTMKGAESVVECIEKLYLHYFEEPPSIIFNEYLCPSFGIMFVYS
jgi:hypothetical protein